MKGTINLELKNPKQSEELKRTRGCAVKHFAFYYDNKCPVHEEAKYGVNYWPQELNFEQFRGMKEEKQDCFDKLD